MGVYRSMVNRLIQREINMSKWVRSMGMPPADDEDEDEDEEESSSDELYLYTFMIFLIIGNVLSYATFIRLNW